MQEADFADFNKETDAVAAAFAAMRNQAAKRGGKLPPINRPRGARKQGNGFAPRPQAEKPELTGDALPKSMQQKAESQGGARQGNHLRRANGRRSTAKPTGRDGRRLPRPNNVESIQAVLGKEIQRRGWGKELASGWVYSHWDQLVGAQVASHTKVEMLKGSVLFVSCDSTAWATNLRTMQKNILQAIAQKVGDGIITELKIFGPKVPSWRHGPLHVKGRGPRDTYG